MDSISMIMEQTSYSLNDYPNVVHVLITITRLSHLVFLIV